MDITWWKSRLKEASTKWGAVLLVAGGALFFTADQLGDYASRLAAATTILGAARLVMVQEAKPVCAS